MRVQIKIMFPPKGVFDPVDNIDLSCPARDLDGHGVRERGGCPSLFSKYEKSKQN